VHGAWGPSPYYTVTLTQTITVRELLAHLYVLIPVLDDDKHYWIGQAEIEKLLRHGEGWLAAHPDREEIALRYLRRQKSLARQALERLTEGEESGDEVVDAEAILERPLRLNEVRMQAVRDKLLQIGAQRVIDLGCGEGNLIRLLLREKHFVKVVGMDPSIRALERASERLHLMDMAPRMRERIDLIHGSLTYRDRRLEGFDAAALVEVIEHLDPSRLEALEQVVFAHARPRCVVVTTPNVEFNTRFEGMAPGQLRHRDHRFVWGRVEFGEWARGVGERQGFAVELESVGEVDVDVGAPCQMAVFRR
jgi:3' terminal RNA ribose 2'-O-methyltransferase Hen1